MPASATAYFAGRQGLVDRWGHHFRVCTVSMRLLQSSQVDRRYDPGTPGAMSSDNEHRR